MSTHRPRSAPACRDFGITAALQNLQICFLEIAELILCVIRADPRPRLIPFELGKLFRHFLVFELGAVTRIHFVDCVGNIAYIGFVDVGHRQLVQPRRRKSLARICVVFGHFSFVNIVTRLITCALIRGRLRFVAHLSLSGNIGQCSSSRGLIRHRLNLPGGHIVSAPPRLGHIWIVGCWQISHREIQFSGIILPIGGVDRHPSPRRVRITVSSV